MKNQTSENRREFIKEASKIVHEWNVHLEIFSRLLRTDILQKTVVWCPWLNNVKFRKRRVLTFLRFCGNNVQSRSFSQHFSKSTSDLCIRANHDFTEVSKITQMCRLKLISYPDLTQFYTEK